MSLSFPSGFVQVIPAWLSCLPIRGDLIEAKVVHDQLCSMVERLVNLMLATLPFLGSPSAGFITGVI